MLGIEPTLCRHLLRFRICNLLPNKLNEFLARLGEIVFRRDGFAELDFHFANAAEGMEAARLGRDQLHVCDEDRDYGQARFLRDVGTFDPAAVNEVRQNGAPALGVLGYNAPSLLGSFALFPMLHNGSALSFEDILANAAHRRAGQLSGTPDPLNNAANREALIAFLKTIDASTKPFKPGE